MSFKYKQETSDDDVLSASWQSDPQLGSATITDVLLARDLQPLIGIECRRTP
jgi:hypothetical protein